jgi:predicted ribosome quality control (RQC) complex YloA/Tae2 family protein
MQTDGQTDRQTERQTTTTGSPTMETHTMEYNADTYTILCGRSAKGNDQLLDECAPHDIWFHVDGQSSAHVILVNEKKEKMNKIPKKVIKRCACICKASTKQTGKCVIIYTLRQDVTKTDVLGCVIPANIKSITL